MLSIQQMSWIAAVVLKMKQHGFLQNFDTVPVSDSRTYLSSSAHSSSNNSPCTTHAHTHTLQSLSKKQIRGKNPSPSFRLYQWKGQAHQLKAEIILQLFFYTKVHIGNKVQVWPYPCTCTLSGWHGKVCPPMPSRHTFATQHPLKTFHYKPLIDQH